VTPAIDEQKLKKLFESYPAVVTFWNCGHMYGTDDTDSVQKLKWTDNEAAYCQECGKNQLIRSVNLRDHEPTL
jgi:predicted metal-binding protein